METSMENNPILVDGEMLSPFVAATGLSAMLETMPELHASLYDGTGAGSDFLGWLQLPSSIEKESLKEMRNFAAYLKEKADYVVVVGIGGSYLGARAVIEGIKNSFFSHRPVKRNPVILYAGHQLSEDYHAELLRFLKDKSFAIVVISKSGTTTEPAIAFRLLKQLLEKQYSRKKARARIVAITDPEKGVLREMVEKEGIKSYSIPGNVGGRYSVLSPVGLVPIALAGLDVREFVKGARDMEKRCSPEVAPQDNPAMVYAAMRNLLYQSGKTTEILATYHPKLQVFAEWWKQLFGESEGKDGKGIFPASVNLTTDLHSMGQYIQDGPRTLFETVIEVQSARHCLEVPLLGEDADGLNFIAGKRLEEVNHMAALGTMLAHSDGGVPVIRISVPALDEYHLGALMYFFEKACALSGYALGVNPFDQPGVEAYKKNMFALLGKPGFEAEGEGLLGRLGQKSESVNP